MRVSTFVISCILVFVMLSQNVQAQVGFNAAYQHNQIDGWQVPPEPYTSIAADGYKFGIDYWFRLKNQRIEFTPEINFAFYNSAPNSGTDYRVEFYGFHFNTNIYLLDLLNDCNCPTFSKQNDFFQKGFFIRIAPGINALRFVDQAETLTGDNASELNYTPSIGLGAGLDIGLSDLVTITPIFLANYMPNAEWTGSNSAEGVLEPVTDIWQFNAGLRLGLRFSSY